ncbi:proline racemase [candidate division KSB1 bacterium]|nr:MAG: proline racemase [candidate division KSB1 bacterium]
MKINTGWEIPEKWTKITTIDAHTEGEPLRVIIGGFPGLQGGTILERRRYAKEHFDHLRTALMWEPRGHPNMYGCIITPPVTPEADFGVLFLHNEGFSTMCGHGIIAVTTVVLKTGIIPVKKPETKVKIDTPAGLVTAFAKIENEEVKSVYFNNVPSFALSLDKTVNVPGIGEIKFDIAFGGAFYAYVRAEEAGVKCIPEYYKLLIEKGMAIKRAVAEKEPPIHPFEKDLSFLYGTIFYETSPSDKADIRNVCIFADGELDRSPTGTGVSGHLAILYAKKKVKIGQPVVIESIIGTHFTGKIVKTVSLEKYSAVIPQVEGTAHITGRHQFLIDPDDPLKYGFYL